MLSRTLKDACVYIVLGFGLSILSRGLNSTFLDAFLANNLLQTLLVLFSINITILGLIVTKLKDFAGDRLSVFKPVIRELRVTIWGQFSILAISLLLLIAFSSEALRCAIPHEHLIVNGILSAGLIYSVDAIRDTARAIFRLYDEEAK